MIGTETISRVIGQDVYDEAGSKIGSASEVYLDDETGQPEWVTVRTGMFGTKQSFVPIRDAELTGDGVRVHVTKDRVKDAPKIDADGHLSPQEEQELYRYYDLSYGVPPTTMPPTTGMTETGTTMPADTTMTDTTMTAGTMPETAMPAGRGMDTDDAMTRSEERLRVGSEPTGERRARLRKYVVTDNVTETVPVRHEEAVIEREPVTEANRDRAMSGPDITESEHEVTLHDERPVVEKETVPVERVRLDKESTTENVNVDENLRREQIEAEGTDRSRERGR